MLTVVERFVSINGEGAHAGEPAAFIRFKGCNLSCSYCDTKWANKNDALSSECTADSLVRWAADQPVNNVTLTGGEPLLQDDIEELIEKLLGLGLRVEIETNGSLPLDRPTLLLENGMQVVHLCLEHPFVVNLRQGIQFLSKSLKVLA